MEGLYERALAFAVKAHEGQVDKAGVPYVEHPVTVASYVDGEIAKAVALLHDVLEDTDATEEELREKFGDEVTDAVVVLTHAEGESYLDYVRRVKRHPLARTVKLADLRHNMNLDRFSVVTERDVRRVVDKYVPALRLLVA